MLMIDNNCYERRCHILHRVFDRVQRMQSSSEGPSEAYHYVYDTTNSCIRLSAYARMRETNNKICPMVIDYMSRNFPTI